MRDGFDGDDREGPDVMAIDSSDNPDGQNARKPTNAMQDKNRGRPNVLALDPSEDPYAEQDPEQPGPERAPEPPTPPPSEEEVAAAQAHERPEVVEFDPELAQGLPLDAFALLHSGDVFERLDGDVPAEGPARAMSYISSQITIDPHGVQDALVDRVKEKIVAQLSGSLQLIARLQAARPIAIDIVPEGMTMESFGYPPRASALAVGLFWDEASWPCARIAFLEKSLWDERGLVIHEMAHAIQRLAFTGVEQELIYGVMLPLYRSRACVDEVFAIYSEREFLDSFNAREGRAIGIYGLARRRWNERHLFTRFVRKLYHPNKPLAGSARNVPLDLLGGWAGNLRFPSGKPHRRRPRRDDEEGGEA